jgi:hypothetical protein
VQTAAIAGPGASPARSDAARTISTNSAERPMPVNAKPATATGTDGAVAASTIPRRRRAAPGWPRSSRARAPSRCICGGAPAEAAAPARSAPPSTPTEKAACRPDRIGLGSRRSTATPWTFIATSSTPAASPIAAVLRTSVPNDPAEPGATIAAPSISPSAVTSGALPRRAASAPVSGWAISTVTVSASSVSPIRPLLRSRWSWIGREACEERGDDEAVEREEDRDGDARAHPAGNAAGEVMLASFPAG